MPDLGAGLRVTSYPRGVTRTRNPRRRVGCLVGLVLAVVLLVGGTLFADRVTHSIAQDVAADALRSQLDATGNADVEIQGFPFLTQLAAGTLDDVRLRADAATLRGMALVGLDATARRVAVHEPRGAESVVVTGTVPIATLESLLRERTGWDLTVTVDGTTLVAGGDVRGAPASVGLTMAAAGVDGLTMTITSASIGGLAVDAAALPDSLGSRLTDIRGLTERLPGSASITAATVQPDGLHVTVELADVTLADL